MKRPILSVTGLLALLLASAAPTAAQTYKNLHEFSGDDGDAGLFPTGALMQALDGALYGTTYGGGTGDCGTVVRLANVTAPLEVLHGFTDAEGCHPHAGLVQAGDGRLYGVTREGGANAAGTLFRLETTQAPAVLTVLHAFADPTVASDGSGPVAALIQGRDGLLYGTTALGGAYDWGTVFRANPAGTSYEVLVSFGSATFEPGPLFAAYYSTGYVPPPVGAYPVAPLLQASDGTFYGTTMMGGNPNGDETPADDPYFRMPGGTVFQLIPPAGGQSSWTVTYHFNFYLGGNGDTPMAALIQTSPTTFLSTTSGLGSVALGEVQVGTIFELDRSEDLFGLYTVHAFTDENNYAQGALPVGALVESDGFFYGTTVVAGPLGGGTIFRMNANTQEVSVVHAFSDEEGEAATTPNATLIKDADGDLYGTAAGGSVFFNFLGFDEAGAIFRLGFRTEQTITFGAPANKTFGDADFSVSATASSGLTVAFGASGNCTIAGASVHLTGAGSCTVTASQAGDSEYYAAPDMPRSFDIAKANQTITFAPLSNKTVGEADFSVSATASSGLAVTFAASGSCTITGASVHLTGIGTCTITASQVGNSNYNAASPVSRSFTISNPAVTLTLSPTSVAGGASVTGTVTLTSPAPNGGAVVNLASSAPAVAGVPATVTIMKGKTSTTFTVTTVAVSSTTVVNISAAFGGTTASRPLTVNAAPPPTLSTLSLNPKAVKGGATSTATVTLTRPAPEGGLLITLTSSNPAVAPNRSVTVAAGSSSATVAITTSPVTAATDVTITASGGGVSRSATLTVRK